MSKQNRRLNWFLSLSSFMKCCLVELSIIANIVTVPYIRVLMRMIKCSARNMHHSFFYASLYRNDKASRRVPSALLVQSVSFSLSCYGIDVTRLRRRN